MPANSTFLIQSSWVVTPDRPGPDPDSEAVAVDEAPSEHDMSRAPAAAAADPAPAYRRKARREWSGDMVRNLRLCDGWDRGGQARERYPAAGGAQTTVTGPPPGGPWNSAPPDT